MGVQVAFSYEGWLELFPEFMPNGSFPVPELRANSYFLMATTVHRNDGGGPVTNAAVQTNLLYWLTAHFAALFATPAGATQASTLVGRISQASEGSVSVTAEMPSNMPAAAAFFTQTKYGLAYWMVSAPFRTARYIPNDRNPVNAGTGIWSPGLLGIGGWIG